MLYKNGKSVINLGKEYNLPKPTIYSWVKNYNNSGSFKAKDNRTVEENELIYLRKENQQLRMENDILKQAALNNRQKMTINLKEFNWEQIKQTFWDLFIQITTIPAHITGGKEIKLIEVPLLWLLIANIAFWFLTAIMVWFILMFLWKTISVFR